MILNNSTKGKRLWFRLSNPFYCTLSREALYEAMIRWRSTARQNRHFRLPTHLTGPH